MHLASYVHLLQEGSTALAESYLVLMRGHPQEQEVVAQASRFGVQCADHADRLAPVRERYGDHAGPPPERLHIPGLTQPRGGGLGLLRDLHEVFDYASHLHIAWVIVGQAAQGNRDEQLRDISRRCGDEVAAQLAWLTTQIKTASPQALLVAD